MGTLSGEHKVLHRVILLRDGEPHPGGSVDDLGCADSANLVDRLDAVPNGSLDSMQRSVEILTPYGPERVRGNSRAEGAEGAGGKRDVGSLLCGVGDQARPECGEDGLIG